MQNKIIHLQTMYSGAMPRVVAVQDDTARSLRCFTDLDLSTISSARIYILKPDNTEVYTDCIVDAENEYIDAPLTQQALAVVGEAKAQLQCTDSDNIITSYSFVIDIAKNYIVESAIESTDEYNALTSLLTKAGEYIVDNLEDMTDTSRIYYVKATGECYAYNNDEWIVIGSTGGESPIPECPSTTDGNYKLQAQVSDGTVTYNWILEE